MPLCCEDAWCFLSSRIEDWQRDAYFPVCQFSAKFLNNFSSVPQCRQQLPQLLVELDGFWRVRCLPVTGFSRSLDSFSGIILRYRRGFIPPDNTKKIRLIFRWKKQLLCIVGSVFVFFLGHAVEWQLRICPWTSRGPAFGTLWVTVGGPKIETEKEIWTLKQT